MKIYNITKGQYITVLVFGIVVWLFSIAEIGAGIDYWGILFLVIPFILVFYTIGWRNYRKRISVNKKNNIKKSKKFIFIIIGVVVAGLLVGLYMYFLRLSKTTTHKVPISSFTQKTPVKRTTPEETAINMVKKSYVLGVVMVENTIRSWMKKRTGELEILGWKAEKINDQTYLVSYTFKDGSGVQGYYFDVNLKGGIIRKVTGDIELEVIYGLRKNPPPLDAKDVREVTWGMSRAEVKSSETADFLSDYDYGVGDVKLLEYNGRFNSVDADWTKIMYWFDKSDKLHCASITLKYDKPFMSDDYYLKQFNRLKYILKNQYGKTNTTITPKAKGKIYENSWETDVTRISHILFLCENTKEQFIRYSSIKYEEQSKQDRQITNDKVIEGKEKPGLELKEEALLRNPLSVFTTKRSDIFHKSYCPKLGTEDFVEFASSQQARNAGGKPCKDCNP